MKTAIIAASRAKYQKIHSEGQTQFDEENLRIELYNARKAKLEAKLVIIMMIYTLYRRNTDISF